MRSAYRSLSECSEHCSNSRLCPDFIHLPRSPVSNRHSEAESAERESQWGKRKLPNLEPLKSVIAADRASAEETARNDYFWSEQSLCSSAAQTPVSPAAHALTATVSAGAGAAGRRVSRRSGAPSSATPTQSRRSGLLSPRSSSGYDPACGRSFRP